jgi:hypothetical protein
MAAKFYSKGSGNEGYIKNLAVVAFNDLNDGSFFQMAIHKTAVGKYYLYGTMGDSVGILEVTDPHYPLFIKRFQTVDKSIYPTTVNPKIQIADSLMIVAMSSNGGPAVLNLNAEDKARIKSMNGVCLYSLHNDPTNPEFLGYWDNGAPFSFGVLRFMYDGGRYVHLSSDAVGFEA